MNFDYYIHDLDPILLPIWGNLAVRWYGLAYVAGFVIAFLILNRWGKRGEFALQGEALQSFMVSIVIGIMVGGRIGYVVFYDWLEFTHNPLIFFRLWEGGMASHGGIVGLALASWYFSRRHKVPLLHLTDGLACVAPIGIFFGRCANFINGELWGRITQVRWAVIFPQEAGIFHGDPVTPEILSDYIQRGILNPRHPSQLYAALLEGVVLGAVVLLTRRTDWAKTYGRLSAVFLGVYAVVRFIGEFFREPEIVHFGWISQGQLLSLVILLPTTAILLARSYRRI